MTNCMKPDDIKKMRRGIMCCIEANQTHLCPADCPYEDVADGESVTYCEGALLTDVKTYIMRLERALHEKRDPEPARLLRPEELRRYCGAAWAEVWIPADDGIPEEKAPFRVGVCNGHFVAEDGDATSREYTEARYNRRYGVRLWTRKPTDAEREAEAWQTDA